MAFFLQIILESLGQLNGGPICHLRGISPQSSGEQIAAYWGSNRQNWPLDSWTLPIPCLYKWQCSLSRKGYTCTQTQEPESALSICPLFPNHHRTQRRLRAKPVIILNCNVLLQYQSPGKELRAKLPLSFNFGTNMQISLKSKHLIYFITYLSVCSVVVVSALSGECEGDLSVELRGDEPRREDVERPCRRISWMARSLSSRKLEVEFKIIRMHFPTL